jgi:four helix bundle protein
VKKFNLIAQMRKSVVSIPSNIAEGYKRQSTTEYKRFLNMAEVSAAELETQTVISKRLYKKVSCKKVKELNSEVQKMLYSLKQKLDSSTDKL